MGVIQLAGRFFDEAGNDFGPGGICVEQPVEFWDNFIRSESIPTFDRHFPLRAQ